MIAEFARASLWTNKFAGYVIVLPMPRSIVRCDSVRFSTPLHCNDDAQARTNNVPLINVLTPCWAEYAPSVNEKREIVTGSRQILFRRRRWTFAEMSQICIRVQFNALITIKDIPSFILQLLLYYWDRCLNVIHSFLCSWIAVYLNKRLSNGGRKVNPMINLPLIKTL